MPRLLKLLERFPYGFHSRKPTTRQRQRQKLTRHIRHQFGCEVLENRTMLAADVYVNDTWIITNNVGPSGLSAGDTVMSSTAAGDTLVTGLIFGTNAFSNLQSAVAASSVTDGMEIGVLKGTYFGDSDITKSVKITGQSTLDVLLGNSSTTGLKIFATKTVDISNVTVQGFSDTGLLVEGTLNLSQSAVVGGGVGIDVFGGTGEGILNLVSSRIQNSNLTGILVEGGNSATATINLSEISAGISGDASAISVTEGLATITGSKLSAGSGSLSAIRMSGSGAVSIAGSDLSNITGGALAVRNLGSGIVDASGNWWGTTSEAAIAAKTSGLVDFTPALASGTDGNGTTLGFVGDRSQLIVTSLGTQVGTSGRINEALNLLADGALSGGNRTIDVNAGTFKETVTISKAVKLRGANAGIAASGIRGAETLIAPSTGSQQTVITPTTTNITIDGLQVQVNQNLFSGAPVAPVGIGATPTTTADFSGLVIKNTRITSIGNNEITGGGDSKKWSGSPSLTVAAAGIVLYDSPSDGIPSVTLTDNDVNITSGTSFWQRAVWLAQLNAQITGNKFAGFSNDLQFQFASGAPSLIENNQFNGLHIVGGAGLVIAEPNSNAPITINNNQFNTTVTPAVAASKALQVNYSGSATSPVVISNNFFTNHNTGIEIGNSANVTISGNTFTPEAGESFTHISIDSQSLASVPGLTSTAISAKIDGNTFNGSGATGSAILLKSTLVGATYTANGVEIGTTADNIYHTGITTGIDVQGGVTTISDHITNSTTGINITGGNATITGTNFDGSVDNQTDLRIQPTASAVTLGAGNNFSGDSLYIDNQSSLTFNLFGANAQSFESSNNFRIEDKIYHKVDNSSSGLVTWHAGNVYVTTPEIGSNDSSIQYGINAVPDASTNWTVNVEAGTFVEDVLVNEQIKLLGAGPTLTTISGPIGGDNATIRVTASNAEVAGFKITREGNSDWNNPGLNSAGVAVQGQATTGFVLHDNLITGVRTGIDLNDSSGHTIRNNVITGNWTGMILRNQTDNLLVTENSITSNFTVGILFLDGSGGTNSTPQQALGSVFTNNNISGNWYGQVVDRHAGGSLPAPGSLTTLKNFSGNWFGTNAVSVGSANSEEPAYASLSSMPTTAPAAPANQLLGPASANIDYTFYLDQSTDTNIETVPGRGTFGFQGNFNSLHVVSEGAQVGTIGRISEAIVAAASTATIYLHAGNYADNVSTAGKAITLSLGSSPGQVVITGSLTLDNNDTLPLEIFGLDPATDFDNLVVSGPVNLGGATITLDRGAFDPFPGETFRIIDNDGTDPVVGTFAGYPQGSIITVAGIPFTISYNGGTGNDFVLSIAQPTTVWVNDNWFVTGSVLPAGLSVGDTVDNSGAGDTGLVTGKIFGYNAFDSIQAAIEAVGVGGTVNVLAGTYIEQVVVNKSISLLGARATDDARGRTGSESIILPSESNPDPFAAPSPAIIYVSASNVTIAGFTLDGDNPMLASGQSLNGADIDAEEGIVSYEGVGNITIQNNIIKNTSYTGINFYNYNNGGLATAGNLIRQNVISNLGAYGYGIGVLLYNNFYADVVDNQILNVRVGVQTGNFFNANPGTSADISHNEISARRTGIFNNLHYLNASPFTIESNTISGVDDVTAPGTARWTGILLASQEASVSANLIDNDIDGSAITTITTTSGYTVWNTPTTGTLTISGGTVSDVDYGIWVNNFEGYSSNAENTQVTISGVDIEAASIGVYVLDSSLNTNGSSVQAMIVGGTTISGTPVGVKVEGADASATIQNSTITGSTTAIDVTGGTATISNNQLHGNGTAIRFGANGGGSVTGNDFDDTTDNSVDLQILATAGNVGIGAGNSFAGNTLYIDNQSNQIYNLINTNAQNFEVTDNFRIEDLIFHKVDNLSSGLVTWVAGNVFVTATTDTTTSTDNTIQRGIDAANAGFTVNVEAGDYSENLTITKDIKLLGDADGGTTLTAGGGSLLTLTGNGFGTADNLVAISHINLDGNSVVTSGMTVLGDAALGTLSLSHAEITEFLNTGILINGLSFSGSDATASALVQNVNLSNLELSLNGISGIAGAADIQFYGFNNNAALTNINVVGSRDELASTGARAAIQFRGIGTNTGADVAPMGNISLTNVDVSGRYRNQMIGLQRYSTANTLSLNNLQLGGATSEITGTFGASLRLDAVGSGTITAPATVDLGNTLFRGLAASSSQRHEIEFAPDNMFTFLRANGTNTRWDVGTIVTAGSLTLAQAHAVEDRILHYVDQANPNHVSNLNSLGGTYNGFVDIKAGNVYINDDAVAGLIGDGSIQRGVEVVAVGGTVNIEAGTFVENVLVNKSVTISGQDLDSNPATQEVKVNPTYNANPALNAGFTLAADGITIHDLQVEGTAIPGANPVGFQFSGTVNGATLSNVLASLNVAGVLVDNGSVVNNLTISNSSFVAGGNGLHINAGGQLHTLNVTGSHFDNNLYGFSSNADVTPGADNTGRVTGINISGSTFNGNTLKGIYTEVLADATFTNVDVDSTNSGTNANAVDLNLKQGTYSNIKFVNSDIVTNQTQRGIYLKGLPTGSGAIPSTAPATVSGVTIEDIRFTTLTGGSGLILEGAVDDVAVTQNTFSGGIGAMLHNGGSVTVTNNFFVGNDAGVVVSAARSGSTTITTNSFADGAYPAQTGSSSRYGLVNASSTAVNATGNWWGSEFGPTSTLNTTSGSPKGVQIINTSTGSISIVPWISDNGVDSNTTVPGFQHTFLDSTAPLAPTVPDLNASSDTLDTNVIPEIGTNTDNYTSDTTPAFSGTAEAGSLVRLYAGTVEVGYAIATGGIWTITSSALANGTYDITATATDSAGNVSVASGALSITIDATAPVAPSTPDLVASSDTLDANVIPGIGTNTDNYTSDTTPTFSGTAEAGSLVRLYAGTVEVGNAIAAGGTWTIMSSALANGTYDITATATDSAGNVSVASGALSVTIDATAPVAPSTPDLAASSDTLDTNASPGIGTNTDNYTSDTTPTFSGTAEAGALIRLYAGAVEVGNAIAVGGTWTITSSALANGTYDITATATDSAGNVSVASGALSITIDATAPVAPSTPDLVASSDTLDTNAAPGIGTNTDNYTSDTTPTFSGTAEAGSLVRLYAGAIEVGTATATGGTWTITSSALANGTYNITATATDIAGNVSVASGALSVTIDATAPVAPSTPDLVASSDTLDTNAVPGIGTNTDNYTSDTTPTFTGTAEVGSLVRLYAGTVEVGNAIAAGGTWTITSSALANGTHDITATATDTAGNVSVASGALSVTIDASAPVAPSTPDLVASSDTLDTNTTPGIGTNTDNYTSDTTPTFSGTAEAGSLVRLYAGAIEVGNVIATGGIWTITSSALANGTYDITATATDSAGNVSVASGALSVTVDVTAPAAPSTPDLVASTDSLDPNATPLIGSNSDNITNDNTPDFTGTAEPGSLIRLFAGSTQIGTATATGGTWTITSTALANGTYDITATATDTAGNVSAASAALSVIIDATAPAAPSTPDLVASTDSLDPNVTPLIGSNSDNITNDNTPDFTGTAEPGSLIRLFAGSTQIGTAMATGGTWTITSSALANGTYDITATATDSAGNVSVASGALSITIDATAPVAPSTPDLVASSDTLDTNAVPGIGTNTDNYTSDTTPTFSGTAEAGSLVRLYAGTVEVGTATATGGTWTITSSALANGTYNITATATDIAGNVSVASSALSVIIDATAPVAPSTPDLAASSDTLDTNASPGIGTNTDNYTSDTTPTFSGTAEPGALIRLYAGALEVGNAIAVGGTWTITSSALANGTYDITATATDSAGNVSVASGALSITIDATAPVAPSTPDLVATSDSGSSNTDNVTNDATPTFTGTAETDALIRLFANGIEVGTTTASGGIWTITSAALADGTYTITATATDTAGNVSSLSGGLINLLIDTVAPVPNPPANAVNSPEGTPVTLSATPTDLGGSGVASHLWTVLGNNGQTLANGTSASYTYTPFDNGLYTFEYTATDVAGNSSAGSVVTVSTSNVAPVLVLSPVTQVNEHGIATLNGTISDVGSADTFTLVVNWGDGSAPVTYTYAAGTTTFSETHQYLDDNPTNSASNTYTISATLTDDDTDSDSESTSVTVNNVAPVLTLNPVMSISENGIATLSGSYTDVGTQDTHTLAINWGDGSTVQVVVVSSGAFSVTHQYLDDDADDSYTITATLTDDDTGADVKTTTVSVSNVAPSSVTILGALANNPEGTAITLTNSFIDPGSIDTWTYSWTATSATETYTGTGSSFTFTPLDDATFTVTLVVTDDDTGVGTATPITISVQDVAPRIEIVSLPSAVNENTTVSLTFRLVDPGLNDLTSTQQVDIDWLDGPLVSINTSTDPARLAALRNGQTVTLTHLYSDDYAANTAADSFVIKFNSFQLDTDKPVPQFLTYTNMALVTAGSSTVTVNNVAPTGFFITSTPTVTAGSPVSVNWLAQADTSPLDASGLRYSYAVDLNNNGELDPGEYVLGDGTYANSVTASSMTFAGSYFLSAGSKKVFGQILDNDLGVTTLAQTITVTATTFRVNALNWNDSGFSVTFNRAADPSAVNLYNWINIGAGGPTGGSANLAPVDLLVTNASGTPINGSLIWNSTFTGFDWVKTGGVLATGSYTVTLVSGDNAFEDATAVNGEDLDGDENGIAGGNYVSSTHTVGLYNSTTMRTVSLPDIARGATATQGQSMNGPFANSSLGLPVMIDNGINVTSVDFQLEYDAALLDIPALAGALDASSFVGLPSGWGVVVAFLDHGATSGIARVNITASTNSMNPLGAGAHQLFRINSSVRAGASYGGVEVLQIKNLEINEGNLIGIADSAVHKAIFVGDADGSGTYDATDVSLISGVEVNNTQPFMGSTGRTGLQAYPTTDPVVAIDVTRNGSISGLDASWLSQKVNYLALPLPLPSVNQPEIPEYPTGVVSNLSAIDPTLDLDDLVITTAGGTVTVPVRVTDSLSPGGVGVLGFTVTGSYDTTKLDLSTAQISLGSHLAGEGNWTFNPTVVDASGAFVITVSRSSGQPTMLSGPGTVLNLNFTTAVNAPDGVVPIDLGGPATTGGGSSPTFAWTYVDGSIKIDSTGPRVSGVYVGSTSWTSTFTNFLQTQGWGDSNGFLIGSQGAQLDDLPWTRLNQIAIKFTEDVVINQGDLVIKGVAVPTYAIDSFSYDPLTFTAKWILNAPLNQEGFSAINRDKILLDLNGDPGGVRDAAGNLLNGEWIDNSGSALSGDATNGGEFKFRFDVLPGNADRGISTGTAGVFGNDVTTIRNAQFSNTSSSSYSIFYDLDGSGGIYGADVNLARDRQFTNLPAGSPALMAQTLMATNTPAPANTAVIPNAVSMPETDDSTEELALTLANSRLESTTLAVGNGTTQATANENQDDALARYFALTEDFLDPAAELFLIGAAKPKKLAAR